MHYKHNESYVAMAMEVDVDKASGAIRVRRVACAHDCGLVINPDALKAQIEGNILQTLSRTLYEEVAFDRSRVTSVDWASYPILSFPDAPEIADRPREPAARAAARRRRGVGHTGAGGARQRGLSTRSARASRRCHSRASGSARRWADRSYPVVAAIGGKLAASFKSDRPESARLRRQSPPAEVS